MSATHSAVHGLDAAATEEWFDNLGKTVAVDFDGVLHPYTNGWTGSVPDDEPPIPGALLFLNKLATKRYRIIVFSTRADHEEGKRGIESWLVKYGLDVLVDGVTHVKPAAVAYVDDRAVPFNGSNWADCVRSVDRLARGRAHGAGHND